MKKNKTLMLIIGSIATLVLAIVAVMTAVKLKQVGTEPIAPTAPKPIPAAEVGPGISPACTLSFSVEPLVCNEGCDSDEQCGGSLVCDLDSGTCRNPECTEEVTCLCPVQSPSPSPSLSPSPSPSPSPSEPPQTHLECVNFACQSISGGGDDICQDNADCKEDEHLTCVNNACVTVSGAGDNSCSDNSQCVELTHLECVNYACTTVSGSGANLCESSSDCAAKTPPPETVEQVELPEAGISAPTIGLMSVGLVTILLGALALLL